VVNTTSTLPPAVNTTDRDEDCFYSCPFNNMSSSEYLEMEAGTVQPCVYTVQVTMVFKGNYTVSCFLFLAMIVTTMAVREQKILCTKLAYS